METILEKIFELQQYWWWRNKKFVLIKQEKVWLKSFFERKTFYENYLRFWLHILIVFVIIFGHKVKMSIFLFVLKTLLQNSTKVTFGKFSGFLIFFEEVCKRNTPSLSFENWTLGILVLPPYFVQKSYRM